MPVKYKNMYATFCTMFPEIAQKIERVGQAKNGAGIAITLNDKTELLFSYVDNKTWWLRTV